eukprot:CAMPEP_0197844906 /NCGR_PEP_ID=MMETSP1438-20131217/1875_1 /TAXON_ID=1461541 /ORGANISM="Pterosperma sp., Strain CCMP1384" /LENGTH=247 /DNA_ID=CAMNT_0043455939 /DNA_START=79 /DNA_END=822 /DNA_ORIENTATION=+
MAPAFPTLDGKEAGRWAPDGRGNGTHFAAGAPPAGGDDKAAKKAAKANEKAAKANEKAAKQAEKALKAIIKEGGKKGVEIAGAADMGGLEFFCSNMMLPMGNPDHLLQSMHAMNKESDPEEEEMKGGSGHVGKMIFSASDDGDDAQVAAVAYVPKDKQNKIDAKVWMEHVLAQYAPTGVLVGSADSGLAVGVVKHSPADGRFLLKDKDNMLPTAREYLKSKGVIPEKEADSDDDMGWMEDAEDEIEW